MFTLHAYDMLKLRYDEDARHRDEFRRGVAYYFANDPDYEKLKNDRWVMLSLLRIVQKTYGWDPFYRFFEVCANQAKAGKSSGSEQEKVDFLVGELSEAANVDLSGYFVRWGFPVSQEVIRKLSTLPQAELEKAARIMAMQYRVAINRKFTR
jgi:hypothetical protein